MRRSCRAGVLGLLAASACTTLPPFDSVEYLRKQLEPQLGIERANHITVPFELNDEVSSYLARRLKPSGTETRRAADIVDFVFYDLDLQYRLRPTRDAVATFRAREGNCLSFVNLFVGIARANRLNSFYVEVTDAQRWSRSEGFVLSQGHIVAGMNVDGKLRTYDFLPYSAKAYRDFKPIDDRTAAAHFYNNLGAEALLAGDLQTATRDVTLATEIAPSFAKGINNLGVCQARAGQKEQAEQTYLRGLGIEPDSGPLLTNLLRLYQQSNRQAEVGDLLARLEGLKISNPFYYVFRGEDALSKGDLDGALRYMVEALRRDSELPETHLGLAEVYLAAGDLQHAREQVQRALKLDATHPEARRMLALLSK
jgi:tetratricopeptide (TPR) repeat protein